MSERIANSCSLDSRPSFPPTRCLKIFQPENDISSDSGGSTTGSHPPTAPLGFSRRSFSPLLYPKTRGSSNIFHRIRKGGRCICIRRALVRREAPAKRRVKRKRNDDTRARVKGCLGDFKRQHKGGQDARRKKERKGGGKKGGRKKHRRAYAGHNSRIMRRFIWTCASRP